MRETTDRRRAETPSCASPRARRQRRASVLIGALLVLALGLSACGAGGTARSIASTADPLYGTLPASGTPANGGTISISQLTGATPTYVMPLLPAAQASGGTTTLIASMFEPLYSVPAGSEPRIDESTSLAELPTYSDGDRTVTIRFRHTYRWANGAPVDADDLVFFIDLAKAAVRESPANYSTYAPGLFPENVVSATAPSRYTAVLKLNRRYNPSFFTDFELLPPAVYPLPSTTWNRASANGPHLDYRVPANATAIYDYLSKQAGQLSGFASNPLWQDVDGPFRLKSFNLTDSSYTLVANPHYGGSPKPRFSELDFKTYTGITSEMNAFTEGDLDIIAPLDFSQLGQVSSLRAAGDSVYGYPGFAFEPAFLNFKDTSGHFDRIIAQPYVRHALQSLIDEPGIVSGVLRGAGGASYGPIPAAPRSPYAPVSASRALYPFSPATATRLLDRHGWKVARLGTTRCVRPGTGADECGAGIPRETPISFTWFYSSASPSLGLESDAFASQAAKLGIHVALRAKTTNFLIQNQDDADPSDARFANTWAVSFAGSFADLVYPTTNSIFNTGGGLNVGAYRSTRADHLISNSIYGAGADAVKAEDAYLTSDLPVLFFPNNDILVAVKKGIGGPPASWLALTQGVFKPQYWYRTK